MIGPPWPAGGVLMLEDDVRLDADVEWWLEQCVAADRPVMGYLAEGCRQNHPPHVLQEYEERGCVTPGLYPIRHEHCAWGAQCVYLPAWFLAQLWADPRLHSTEADGKAIDALLALVWGQLPSRKLPLVAIPNFCRHLGYDSVLKLTWRRNQGPRKASVSLTHDWRACG